MSGVAAAVVIGGAIIGGVAGAQKDKASGSSSSGVDLAPESALEKRGTGMIGDNMSSLEQMVNAGPGQSDVAAGYQQTGSLAEMLKGFAQTGGAPGQQDILQAQEMAKLQFAPQQMQLDQSFEQEKLRANQMAAQLGRPINDPYIQAQLSKERMNMQNMMGAQQGAFIGQESRANAMSRLGFTSQLTDVKNSLASQAMSNRQALLSLGQGVQGAERNWRYQISNKWGKQEQESGGGQKGMLTGGLAGAGMGMSMAGGMGGGGMGSMGSKPQQMQQGPMHGPQMPEAGSAVMMPMPMGQTTSQYSRQSRLMPSTRRGAGGYNAQ